MRNVKAVIFDMDGVIFDTEKIYLEVWKRIFNNYGYKLTNGLYTSVMGRGRKSVIETFLKEYGEDMPIEEMYKEKDLELTKFMGENAIELKKGALELLDYLNNNGYKVALATSSKRDRAIKNLKSARIEDMFHDIVCGDEIYNLKPNPEIFIKAALKLGLKVEHCMVIEDSPAGLKAAFNAGMKVINIPDLKKPDEEMISNSHKVMGDLIEVKKYLKTKK